MSFIGNVNLGIKSLWYSLSTTLRFHCLAKKEQLNNGSNVIISLTTFPPRIKHVILTLKSILNQSVKPARVILHLSKEQFCYEELPKRLIDLQAYGLTIEFVDGDIKSYKKLFYAKSKYNSMSIITADDDVCYPTNWLEKMLETALKYPNDIIFYRGHIICDDNGNLLPYRRMLEKNTRGVKSSLYFIPTGVCGVLYPPNSMHIDWSNLELAIKLAPNADDIWFKTMTLLFKVNCTRVNEYNVLFPPVLGSQKNALKNTNTDSVGINNDRQLNMVFEHYELIRKGKLLF